MLTLIEAAKLAKGDVHRQTIIELFARSTPLLQALPFMDIEGNAYHYNREEALPGIGFRGINEGFQESAGVVNPQTEALVIAGGDLDVDRFLVETQGASVRGTHEAMKVKALAQAIAHSFIKGDNTTNAREFDGLQARLVAGGPQVFDASGQNQTAGGDPLEVLQLNAAIDSVDGPTHLMMSKAMRRRLTQASDEQVIGHVEIAKNELGQQVTMYAGLPIIEADPNNGAYKTLAFDEAGPGGGATSSSIYVLSLEDGKLHGIQRREMDVRDLGELEVKPAFRTRVEWYVGMVLLNPRAAARVWGIKDAPFVYG